MPASPDPLKRSRGQKDRFLVDLSRQIHERALFQPGERLLVAVSGGVDSVVLLQALCALLPDPAATLTVAHFDHQIRGAASWADAQWVQALAQSLGLPYCGGKGSVLRWGRAQGLSVEMAARELRFKFLRRAARVHRCSAVVTAHHAEDQMELFFLRAARGAGGDGLSGMDWSEPFPMGASAGLRLIRPLLALTKKQIHAWATQHGYAFREDATNAEDIGLRNRLRNRVLPLWVQEMGEGAVAATCRSMEILRDESRCVEDFARQWSLDPTGRPFDSLPAAIQRQVLRLQLIELGQAPEFDLIEHLRQHPGKPMSVSGQPLGGRRLVSNPRGRVSWMESGAVPAFGQECISVALSCVKGRLELPGGRIRWYAVRRTPGAGLPKVSKGFEVFDRAKVGNKVVLRHWQPGDRFRPLGFKGSAKLQDLFVNLKVPVEVRRRLWLASGQGGEVFWVEGLRPGDAFKVTPSTRDCLVWGLESCA